MTPGQIVLIAYGVLMLVGGFMGYRAGSKVSLIAGGGSGLLLLLAWVITLSDLAAGLWFGAGLSALLTVMMGRRFVKTRKAMPAGLLFGAGAVALLLLLGSLLGR